MDHDAGSSWMQDCSVTDTTNSWTLVRKRYSVPAVQYQGNSNGSAFSCRCILSAAVGDSQRRNSGIDSGHQCVASICLHIHNHWVNGNQNYSNSFHLPKQQDTSSDKHSYTGRPSVLDCRLTFAATVSACRQRKGKLREIHLK